MREKGFTLIELLLSIAVIGILSMISVPIYQSFQNKNDLNIARDTIVQALRQTQTLAYSSYRDDDWGLHIGVLQISGEREPDPDNENENIGLVIFKGNDYGTRDKDSDEKIKLSNGIMRAEKNIIFTKFSGELQEPNEIIIYSNNSTSTITINAKGIISY